MNITAARAFPVAIPLHTPFGIASSEKREAENVIVEITLDDGTVGIGEAAPFYSISGEDQGSTLEALEPTIEPLIGQAIEAYESLLDPAKAALAPAPAALCALESALLDAFLRHERQSAFVHFGGRNPVLETDITISTGSLDDAHAQSQRAVEQGFSTLKIKVGGSSLDHDRARIARIARAAPRAHLLLDGNEAFDQAEAVELLLAVAREGVALQAFEQPTPADDREALRNIAERTGVWVIADESARSVTDVDNLARLGVRAVNIKIMKTGVFEALKMIDRCRYYGLEMMIGGMVESDIAMGLSAAIAAGGGGFRWIDLDTPLFMAEGIVQSEVVRRGPCIELGAVSTGHGARLVAQSPT
jgi:L-alanine-DL-glutamate epimerase-like enolase superfamily enzyme